MELKNIDTIYYVNIKSIMIIFWRKDDGIFIQIWYICCNIVLMKRLLPTIGCFKGYHVFYISCILCFYYLLISGIKILDTDQTLNYEYFYPRIHDVGKKKKYTLLQNLSTTWFICFWRISVHISFQWMCNTSLIDKVVFD